MRKEKLYASFAVPELTRVRVSLVNVRANGLLLEEILRLVGGDEDGSEEVMSQSKVV